jgi:hypothetical protein
MMAAIVMTVVMKIVMHDRNRVLERVFQRLQEWMLVSDLECRCCLNSLSDTHDVCCEAKGGFLILLPYRWFAPTIIQ